MTRRATAGAKLPSLATAVAAWMAGLALAQAPGGRVDAAAIAANGVPTRGVAACAGCHGSRGEGMAAGGFPRLAAQSSEYLLRQLESYADGRRDSPVMTPIAKGLSAAQAQELASYYGRLDGTEQVAIATAAPPPAGSPADLARGRKLAAEGDDALQVQSCANCHGPGGAGEAPAYPYLGGQHATYLTAALAQWKTGGRRNDPSGQMPAIASRLSDADIAALAGYYSHQPSPAISQRGTPPTAATRVGTSSSPTIPPADGTGQQGVGTEAGAPLTGGGQTPGGGGATTGTNPTRPQAPQPQR